jgi:hypothetical protein
MGAEDLLLDRILPQNARQWFVVQEVVEEGGILHIFLEEKAQPPEYTEPLEAHGFLPVKELRDFPIRGMPCCLRLKRRRWLIKGTTRCVMNEYSLEQAGTKLTKGFAFF